ncbi:MAG: hypothetical protein GY793_08030 [Proteobacteria bacterium]|nr:hypothetical protein [Pseudomonadota bacterium]
MNKIVFAFSMMLVLCFFSLNNAVAKTVNNHSYAKLYYQIQKYLPFVEAYKHKKVVPLKYSSQNAKLAMLNFATDMDKASVEKLVSPVFFDGVKKTVGVVAATIMRHYKNNLEVNLDGFKTIAARGGKTEGTPFFAKNSQYYSSPLEINYPNIGAKGEIDSNVFYEFELDSGHRHSPKSWLFPVHSLGRNIGDLHRNNLVLTIKVKGYNVADGNKTVPLNSEEEYFWVIIPSPNELARHSSELEAAKYALNNSYMFTIDWKDR